MHFIFFFFAIVPSVLSRHVQMTQGPRLSQSKLDFSAGYCRSPHWRKRNDFFLTYRLHFLPFPFTLRIRFPLRSAFCSEISMNYVHSSSSYERNWSEGDVACATWGVVLLLRPAGFILITRAWGCLGWISLPRMWVSGRNDSRGLTDFKWLTDFQGSHMNTEKRNFRLILLYLNWCWIMRFYSLI